MLHARKRLLKHRYGKLRYQEAVYEIPVPANDKELKELGYKGMVELKLETTLRPFRTYRKYASKYRYAVLLPVDYNGYATWYTFTGDRE